MTTYLPIPIAVIALLIFGYLRNKQADRNDRRRQRLEDRKEELIQMLKNKNESENEN